MNRRTSIARILTAAAAVLAVAAPSASAGVLTASAGECVDRAWSNPFVPWLDPANYVQAPDGGFENGGAGWALTGDAAVVDGNESFYVGSESDSKSLSVPTASSATSAAMCLGIEHPTLRLFAKSKGATLGSYLRVEVLWEDAAGNVQASTIGAIGRDADWEPTAPMVVTTSLLTLLPGNHTPGAFRFTPVGTGTWSIDDVYVDPYARH